MNMQIKDVRPELKHINLVFIILEVGPPVITKTNRELRCFKVADASACINICIFDEASRLLVPGDIVKLTNGFASFFRDSLTLYVGKNGTVHKVGEFCMLFNEELDMSKPNPALRAQYSLTNSLLVNTNEVNINSAMVNKDKSRSPHSNPSSPLSIPSSPLSNPSSPRNQSPAPVRDNSLSPKVNNTEDNEPGREFYGSDNNDSSKNSVMSKTNSKNKGSKKPRNVSRERM